MWRATVAAAVLALVGGPAFATEANCLLMQMTEGQKEAVRTAYVAGGIRAVANAAELTLEQVAPCIGSPSTDKEWSDAGFRVGIAFSATRREFATGEFLTRKYGLPPQSLDVAWERLSPEDRSTLRSIVALPAREGAHAEQGVIDEVYLAALERLAVAAGITGRADRPSANPDFKVVLDHYIARAVREEAEATFR